MKGKKYDYFYKLFSIEINVARYTFWVHILLVLVAKYIFDIKIE